MSAAGGQADFGQASLLDSSRSPKISSKRRSRTRDIVETTAVSFVPESACEAVREACKDALESWPNAKAAILYGSRARGDHRAYSDWDIAFITSNNASLPSSVIRVFDGLREHSGIDVQAQAISQVRFHEHADSLGDIAAPVAREGRLIAGSCEWPKIERNPVLKPRQYTMWRNGALKRIASASENLSMAIDYAHDGDLLDELGEFMADSSDASEFFANDYTDSSDALSELGEFVAASSDAAERFAKIAFGRLASGTGAAIPKRHQINEIVKKLDRVLEHGTGPNASWWRSDRSEKLRDLLCMMNGHGDKDHQYGYPEPTLDAEVVARAANRLIATASFAILETEELPDLGGLQKAAQAGARSQWRTVLGSARRLRRTLQALESSKKTFSSIDSELAESVSAAMRYGEAIAEANEKLADKLYEQMGFESRARVNAVVFVAGFYPDGKPLAIADDAEAIMNRADVISGSRQPRDGAGLKLIKSKDFDQTLSTLGFASVPPPRILSSSKAKELAENRKGLDADETALREALAKLLRERQ